MELAEHERKQSVSLCCGKEFECCRRRFGVMAGYHLGLCDAEGIESAGNSGKGLRPGLVLAAAQACGARSADVVAAAATAVELVQSSKLSAWSSSSRRRSWATVPGALAELTPGITINRQPARDVLYVVPRTAQTPRRRTSNRSTPSWLR